MFKSHPLFLYPDFRRLFLGRITSALGDKIFTIALAWWMIQRNDSTMLGLLMAVNVAPVVIFGPAMGTLADRHDRRKCMLIADLARSAVVLLLWVFYTNGSLSNGLLFGLVFLTGSFTPLFEGSASSSLMELTDGKDLERVVAMDSMVMHVAAAMGAFAGSLFLVWLGIGGAFLLYSITFLISFSFIFRIRKALPSQATEAGYLTQLMQGFAYLKSEAPLFSLVALFALLNFFIAPIMLFIPMMVKEHLSAGVTWLAILEGALALGSVLTAFGLSLKNPFKNAYPAIGLAILSMSLLILAMAHSHQRYTVMLLVLLTGAGLSIVNTLAISLFQGHVPDHLKGRFFAILNTLCFAAMPLAFLINGMALKTISLKHLMIMNALAALFLSLPAFFIPRLPEAQTSDAEEQIPA